ncbi:MAG: TrkA C-terminal domain-containing protein [Candidatus Competibacteraceae bacterium]|nr:TrkA C-terminal domain-containing protein [Candidatus Competibacteraceae bacterium]
MPISRVVRRVREQREGRYRLLREFFRSDHRSAERLPERDAHRLWSVVLPADSPVVGRPLGEIELAGVVVTALVRRRERRLTPPLETRLEAGDIVVLFGAPDDLRRAERVLLG